MNYAELAAETGMTPDDIKICLSILIQECHRDGVVEVKKDIDAILATARRIVEQHNIENERSRQVVNELAGRYNFSPNDVIYRLGRFDRRASRLPRLSAEDFNRLVQTHNHPPINIELRATHCNKNDTVQLDWTNDFSGQIGTRASIRALRRLGYHVATFRGDEDKYVSTVILSL